MGNARNLARILADSSGAIAIANLGNAPNPILPGTVAYLGMSNAPVGWLKANGAAISRTVYADLFAAIGTTFGPGDGSSTFNLPDLRGEFVRGHDDGRGVDAGRVFGSWQNSDNKSHNHTGSTSSDGWHDHSVPGYFASTYTVYDGDLDGSSRATGYDKTTVGGGTYGNGTHAHSFTTAVSGTDAKPRNVAMLACIKY